MKILFAGGGTLGPVTPLLAMAKAMKTEDPSLSFHWIGTASGPEQILVEAAHIFFSAVPTVKWPRYFSWQWFTFPFAWVRARHAAKRLIKDIKPDAIVTVGGHAAVPVVFAAAKKGIPCFAHQLDLIPGLANRLVAPKCQFITTSFEYSKAPFGDRVSDEPAATPVRFALKDLPSHHAGLESFGLHATHPVVLVIGGGTGAQALNESIERSLKEWLEFTQIIHVTGISKGSVHASKKGYVVRELLNQQEMAQAYAVVDLIITRAGIGSLSEIASLEKAAVIVPIPKSQQEANAHAFEEAGAAIVVSQISRTFDRELLDASRLLLADKTERIAMGKRAHAFFKTDDGTMVAKKILKELNTQYEARS